MATTRRHHWALLGALATTLTMPAYAVFPDLQSDGSGNSGFGSLTLQFASGSFNTASGNEALFANTTGASNTATGRQALFNNTSGSFNTAVGVQALFTNTRRGDNTAVGYQALFSNNTGTHNVATGNYALRLNTTGVNNTATGYQALGQNTSGHFNSALGSGALAINISGRYNTAVGSEALARNTLGSNNTASGANALLANKSGINNTANGANALRDNRSGSGNIALGSNAGRNLTTGSNNIAIGHPGIAGESGVIRLGVPGRQTRTYVAGVFGSTTFGAVVIIDKNGQMGVASSSRRYKQDIEAMGDASEALMKLRPVSFRYKEADSRGRKPRQFGLIAEEVAQVMPELVVTNQAGQPETVAYQTLSTLLLNEFQKQQHQLATVETLAKAQAAALKAQQARNESREQELMALRADLAELKQATRQLLAAQRGPQDLATLEP